MPAPAFVTVTRLLPLLVLAGCLGTADSEPLAVPSAAPEAGTVAAGAVAADTVVVDSVRSMALPPPIPMRAPEPLAPEAPDLPEGFVRLSATAPEIALEMRYTTAYNFVGEPIDGYLAPECILSEEAADKLKLVAADLEADGLGLKVYDCYRPQDAVNHFARWASGSDASMKTAFYPDERRGRLFQRGYIATRSGHSRGSTVDLTLVQLPASGAVMRTYPSPEALQRCDAPRGQRLDEGDLDMGTAYDCLDASAATASGAVSRTAQRNRQRLKSAMRARGFINYSKEWWHFTLGGEPFRGQYFNFPVE